MSLTQDLRLIDMDDAGYAHAVATARAFRSGDDPSCFAFTGQVTLVFQRTDAAWQHTAFSSQPIVTYLHPIEGTTDAQDAQDPALLAAVSERVTFLHVPVQCQDMRVDDVWSIDCEFVMFAVPHPEDEAATAWLLVPGPEGRVISSQKTLQDYHFAELQRAAQARQDAQQDADADPNTAAGGDTLH